MNNNFQDRILSKLQQERQAVTVFVTNGFQMKGRITGFDRRTIMLEIRGEQQLVFKHAISTIQLGTPVDLDGLRGEE